MPIYSTGKKKDGKSQYRVIVNYTTPDGRHRKKEQRVYGYSEAKIIEQQMLNLLKADPANLGGLTFREFFTNVYCPYKEPDIREATFDQIKKVFNNHIIPHLGDYKFNEVTPAVLLQWRTTINSKPLATITKNNAYSKLRALFRFAVRFELRHDDPTINLGKFREANPIAQEEKIQYYTSEEFTKFMRAAKGSCHSWCQQCGFVFFAIAYYTGMRKGEIHALKWSDISGDLIHVRRSISQKIKGKQIVEGPPKNASSYRTLQIPVPLMAILAEHKALQMQKFGERKISELRVVGGTKCIADTSLSNYNIEWAQKAGLHPIRIHDFRHSHASLLVNAGISIQEVARRLGHSDPSITLKTYAHLYPQEKERALTILNQIQV